MPSDGEAVSLFLSVLCLEATVTGCPIPTRLQTFLPRQDHEEFRFMRYVCLSFACISLEHRDEWHYALKNGHQKSPRSLDDTCLTNFADLLLLILQTSS